MQEFDSNEKLKSLYKDILWEKPRLQAPKWAENEGICVRSSANPKEQTIEAHGLVDGQPTGRHFDLIIYDDVVVQESVSTPEQISQDNNSVGVVIESWIYAFPKISICRNKVFLR